MRKIDNNLDNTDREPPRRVERELERERTTCSVVCAYTHIVVHVVRVSAFCVPQGEVRGKLRSPVTHTHTHKLRGALSDLSTYTRQCWAHTMLCVARTGRRYRSVNMRARRELANISEVIRIIHT